MCAVCTTLLYFHSYYLAGDIKETSHANNASTPKIITAKNKTTSKTIPVFFNTVLKLGQDTFLSSDQLFTKNAPSLLNRPGFFALAWAAIVLLLTWILCELCAFCRICSTCYVQVCQLSSCRFWKCRNCVVYTRCKQEQPWLCYLFSLPLVNSPVLRKALIKITFSHAKNYTPYGMLVNNNIFVNQCQRKLGHLTTKKPIDIIQLW